MKIPKGVVYLGLASFMTDVAGEMIYPLLPVFFTGTLGAGVLFLGVFEGTAESVASLSKYFFGAASDRAERREPFVLWGYLAANGLRPLIGLVTAPWQALALRAADRMAKGVRSSPRDAWLGQMAAPEQRGAVYGFHQAMDHAGAVLGPLLATLFLWLFPGRYRALFLLTAVPGLSAAWFIRRAAQVQPAVKTPASSAAGSPGWGWVPGPLKAYLAVLALFALCLASDAFLLLKLKDVGVPEMWIPALWAALHVVKSASSAAGGRLSDAAGRKRTILAGWSLYAAFYFAFARVQTPGAMTAVFLAYGVFYGLTDGPEKALVAELAPPDRQGAAFGLYNMVMGLGVLPASVLFGWIWKKAGSPAAFTTVAAGAAVCAALLALLPLPEKKKALPA
jgi:MFS family permease